ncbi:MAG: biotin-dependent carboxyltransferase family protein [Acidobacteria bacterium]|nr:biotin-dependent carboxyltransferase family protein [Acidobacteriota bacterium]
MKLAFKVLKSSLLTSVQDLGRFGYQQFGVPVSGAMDSFALRLGNLLVENPPDAAGLEITLAGPDLLVCTDLVLAFTGGDLQPQIDGEPAPLWQSLRVSVNSVVSFGHRVRGARAYLTVAGGLRVPPVLGSMSTDLRTPLGGYEGRPLRKGDALEMGSPAVALSELLGRKVRVEALWEYARPHELRVVLGPQDDCFPPESLQKFLTESFTIAPQSNRQGYRLEGPEILSHPGAELISDAIPLGAVQVPSGGKPILLLADRQSVGGYPKIAVVISSDLHKAAQLATGDEIRFLPVSLEEAHRLLRQQEETLAHALTS